MDLLPGTLDLLILQVLRFGPRHGYGIAQMIRARSSEILAVETGSLYPALHRLERKKLIASAWTQSEKRQRVKVYRLTPAGRKQLAAERMHWRQLVTAVGGVLGRTVRR
jgi:PadR family transcriptional regulator